MNSATSKVIQGLEEAIAHARGDGVRLTRSTAAGKRFEVVDAVRLHAVRQVEWFRDNGVGLSDILLSIGVAPNGMLGWDDAVEALHALATREGYCTSDGKA